MDDGGELVKLVKTSEGGRECKGTELSGNTRANGKLSHERTNQRKNAQSGKSAFCICSDDYVCICT